MSKTWDDVLRKMIFFHPWTPAVMQKVHGLAGAQPTAAQIVDAMVHTCLRAYHFSLVSQARQTGQCLFDKHTRCLGVWGRVRRENCYCQILQARLTAVTWARKSRHSRWERPGLIL